MRFVQSLKLESINKQLNWLDRFLPWIFMGLYLIYQRNYNLDIIAGLFIGQIYLIIDNYFEF